MNAEFAAGTPGLPPVSILSGALVAELEEYPGDLTIVFENMNLVTDKSVFDLLSQVLKSPLASKRFVIISRHDPFLPISTLRANNQLNELRTEDLKFTVREVRAFLEKSLSREVDAETSALWQERTEGWVTGLQLAVHSLASQETDESEKQSSIGPVNWRTLLTNREYDVLLLLQQRLRDKEIADRLCISTGTVRTHLKNLYSKLDATNRRDVVVKAEKLQILD